MEKESRVKLTRIVYLQKFYTFSFTPQIALRDETKMVTI